MTAAAPPAEGAPTALRVLVADDEPVALRRLARLLAEVPDVRIVAACASGREALRDARALRPDVLFLDVEMPGLDGLAVARALAEERAEPVVVFVTAYDEHAVAAFRVHASDYVVKPLDRARLRDAVEHARRAARRAHYASRLEAGAASGAAAEAAPAPRPARFAVRDGRGVRFVPVGDILWVQSFGNYARVHTRAARHIHRGTMASLAEQLEPYGFARVHRTAIANAGHVTGLRRTGTGRVEAVLDTGVRLRVGRAYRAALEQRLLGAVDR